MNIRSNIVSQAVLIALGVVGVAGTALADHSQWGKAQGRNQDRLSYQQRSHRDNGDDFAYARVIDVDPIVRRVRVSSPQQECWNEERAVPIAPRTQVRSTIVGGLIGAAVGHHVGVLHNVRDPGAVVGGSLIGAAIGNSIGVHKADRRGEYRDVVYQPVQRCEVNYREQWVEEIESYRVTYLYEGRRYVANLPYDPGRRVRVDVDVRPAFARRN